jgi:hypothetical protein
MSPPMRRPLSSRMAITRGMPTKRRNRKIRRKKIASQKIWLG